MCEEVKAKYEKLLEVIKPYGRAVIAFSGGVDSTLLAYASAEALGRENIVCVTARALSFPARELEEAEAFCAEQDIRHEIIDFDELNVGGFAANPPDRCYLCKHALFSLFIGVAERERIGFVFDGSNADDPDDFRPGMRAVMELGVKSPLNEAGLVKKDIREILKTLGLHVWDKQPFACLASRIPYGEEITAEKLNMVEKAEQFLFIRGFENLRVRIHGDGCYVARIEVLPEELVRFSGEALRSETEMYFKSLGFTWVSLDLTGYRTGSMNEALSLE